MNRVEFIVYGKVQTNQRHRHSGKRTYTPKETVEARQAVVKAFMAATAIRSDWPGPEFGTALFGESPVRLHVRILHKRPMSHWTGKGTLSAAGRREPHCVRKPDIDNVVKLIGDALNGVAFKDDAQIISVNAERRWIVSDDERVEVTIWRVD